MDAPSQSGACLLGLHTSLPGLRAPADLSPPGLPLAPVDPSPPGLLFPHPSGSLECVSSLLEASVTLYPHQ